MKYQKLPVIISNYKAAVSRQINKVNPDLKFKWQPSYYDRVIRNEKELGNIQNYVTYNPINWNEDWENELFKRNLSRIERNELIKKAYDKLFQ